MLLSDKDLHWWILCPCGLTNYLCRLWLTGAFFMPTLCGTALPAWSSIVCWQVPSAGGGEQDAEACGFDHVGDPPHVNPA